jgi:hypothetical protein
MFPALVSRYSLIRLESQQMILKKEILNGVLTNILLKKTLKSKFKIRIERRGLG